MQCAFFLSLERPQMKIDMELVFDPQDFPPLKLKYPTGVNPAVVVSLLSQAITGVCNAQLQNGEGERLIVPANLIHKIAKTQ